MADKTPVIIKAETDKTQWGPLNKFKVNLGNRTSVPAGIKYNRFGARHGEFSIKDAGLIDDRFAKQRTAHGSIAVRNKYYESDGVTVITTGREINGRYCLPDTEGFFTMIDESVIDAEQSIQDEIEEEIDRVISKCLISDHFCQQILGKAMFDGLEPSKHTKDAFLGSESLFTANAKPSFLKILPATEKAYGLGISKMRQMIVHSGRIPILSRQESAAEVKEIVKEL